MHMLAPQISRSHSAIVCMLPLIAPQISRSRSVIAGVLPLIAQHIFYTHLYLLTFSFIVLFPQDLGYNREPNIVVVAQTALL